MKRSEIYGPLTQSDLTAMIIDAPLYQAKNLLWRIQDDVRLNDGWYSDTAPEIATLARRWLARIEDMDDMDYGRWVDIEFDRKYV